MKVPDLILHNARIATLDPLLPEVSAVAIAEGRIMETGDERTILKLAGATTQIIDLKGYTVIPGLNDSHIHVIRGGLNYNMELRWDGVPSLADRPADAQGTGAAHTARPMGARRGRLERIPIRGAADADAG